MGAWGIEPWDNDGAADWFDDLFDKTGLARHIEAGLNLEIEDYHEEVRAAAYLVRKLARGYIWPADDIERIRALAADRLQEILNRKLIEEPEFNEAIASEVEALRDPEGV